MFSGLPCETHIAHIAHIARTRGEWMFSGLPCETHIAHIARIARTRGTVRVRRVGAPYAPHLAWFFAWFLQHVEQLAFLHGFARFLHDMWNSLFFA